jgi:hypothetical protein
MSASLKERLAQQRDAVAATGAGADDVLRHDKSRDSKSRVDTSRDDKSRVVIPERKKPVIEAEAEAEAEPSTRTQGIPISASDDAIIAEMEAFCRRKKIKVRRNSNVSLITRAGWRLLYDLMQRDPAAFAAAIEAGRPPRIATT